MIKASETYESAEEEAKTSVNVDPLVIPIEVLAVSLLREFIEWYEQEHSDSIASYDQDTKIRR